MIEGLKVLALIPARGGSKGIKNKNIINLCGKPLISYTIDTAKSSKYIDDIIVSTDNEKIAKVSRRYGAEVPFMRPDVLAQDKSKTIDAVIHALETLKSINRCYDILVLLQPTQPLRTTEDIDNALEHFIKNNKESLVSVSEVNDHPILIRSIDENNRLVPILTQNSTIRRQDMPKYYRVDGCIYINKIDEINNNTSFNDNICPFIIDKSHAVDIDEISDLILAKYYIDLSNKKLKLNK